MRRAAGYLIAGPYFLVLCSVGIGVVSSNHGVLQIGLLLLYLVLAAALLVFASYLVASADTDRSRELEQDPA